jgi:hypothetical protein
VLEGVIAQHDAIKREVGLLRQLAEKSAAMRDGVLEEGGADAGVGGWGDGDDDDARSVCTIVPHELESIEEEDEEQIARQEQQHEHERQQEE